MTSENFQPFGLDPNVLRLDRKMFYDVNRKSETSGRHINSLRPGDAYMRQ